MEQVFMDKEIDQVLSTPYCVSHLTPVHLWSCSILEHPQL